MNPSIERGTQNPEIKKKPDFAETIKGTNGRVGILEDGSFAVGIEQPPPLGHEHGKVAWHYHPDAFSVVRQNSRIIQRYLGVPIPRDEKDIKEGDPNLITLPQAREILIIPGENLETSRFAQKIMNIATSTSVSQIGYDEATSVLASVKDRLERVKNPHKIEARDNITSILQNGEEIDIVKLFASAQELLKRTEQGLNITNSLLNRGKNVLNWAEMTESNILRVEFTLRHAINDLLRSQITPQKLAEWERDFFDPESSVFNSLDKIRGNPYKKVAESPEIKSFRNRGRDTLNSRGFEELERLAERAYIPLLNARESRKNRIDSGEFNLYKSQKDIKRDKEDAKFDEEIISLVKSSS